METFNNVLTHILGLVAVGCIIAGIVGEALDTVYYLETIYWFLIAIAVSVLAVWSAIRALYAGTEVVKE
ncbi:unnamed protein product [marine sediment metagenome]|uniref:Uncharacterized protein n=1 Tax=marine sediment metagenome TaxID=412755 RepID=X0WMU7_9ZZZZ